MTPDVKRDAVAHSQWFLPKGAESTMRELGERGDVIIRMHRTPSDRGVGRGTPTLVIAGEDLSDQVLGCLMDRGLNDELKGPVFVVIYGVEGRVSFYCRHSYPLGSQEVRR